MTDDRIIVGDAGRGRREWRRSPLLGWCAAAAVVVIGGVLTVVFWEKLHGKEGGEGYSTTLSNMAFVIGAAAAGVVTAWRLALGSRQAETQEKLAETQEKLAAAQVKQAEARTAAAEAEARHVTEAAEAQAKQAEIEVKLAALQRLNEERGLLDDRFRGDMEMLRSTDLATRVAGVEGLAKLAADHPDEMHTTVLAAFCAYIRERPTGRRVAKTGASSSVGEDPVVKAVMYAIGSRSERQIKLERDHTNWNPDRLLLDLRGADLHNLDLRKCNLSGADLFDADLSGVHFSGVDLSWADLRRADLTGAHLFEVDLSWRTLVSEANISGARLHGVKITQENLDLTTAEEGRPPIIHDVSDPETGEPVIWEGREGRREREEEEVRRDVRGMALKRIERIRADMEEYTRMQDGEPDRWW